MLKFAEVKNLRLEAAGVLHISIPNFSQMTWQRIILQVYYKEKDKELPLLVVEDDGPPLSNR